MMARSSHLGGAAAIDKSREDLRLIIWQQTSIHPVSDCWLWCGPINGHGYGAINGRLPPVHRISWMVFRRPIPKGLHVCHKCDVRSCVNPDHLWLGTNDDNMADMAAKGRSQPHRGESNGYAKLTADQALAIFEAEGSHRAIARRFGIDRSTVGNIKRRETWAHMHEEPR